MYRVWERCNEDDGGGSGCLAAIPVFSGNRLSEYLPSPRLLVIVCPSSYPEWSSCRDTSHINRYRFV